MTPDELLGKIDPLLRELAQHLGQSVQVGVRLPDEYVDHALVTVHVSNEIYGYGSAPSPYAALTGALSDYERGKAKREQLALFYALAA